MDFEFGKFCGGCNSTRKKEEREGGAAAEHSDRVKPLQAYPKNDQDKNLPFEFTAQQQLRDDSPEDALHLAAATGNLKWINEWEVLAQTQGAGFREICLNTQNPRTGMTPLHHAAAMGELAMIKRLVELGAEADAADLYGRTPLLIAKRCGHRDAFEWIRWKLYNTKRSQFDQNSIPGPSTGVRGSSHLVPSKVLFDSPDSSRSFASSPQVPSSDVDPESGERVFHY